jgi:hypothetical protein
MRITAYPVTTTPKKKNQIDITRITNVEVMVSDKDSDD